jgi:hypothetical protein
MPGRDRTGPIGAGPMTGRWMGHCIGFHASGSLQPGPPLRLGGSWGEWGAGWGWRHGWRQGGWPGWMRFCGWLPSKAQELEVLKEQAEFLDGQRETIRRRIDEVEGEEG